MKPAFLPTGTSYPIAAAGYIVTILLEGGAALAAIVISNYQVLTSQLTLTVLVNYKVLCTMWPISLFAYNELMVVSTT